MTTNGDQHSGRRDPKAGTGSEGEASNDTALPFVPRKDDDTPVGTTDQHSKVDHNTTAEQDAIKREGAKAS